MALARTTAMMLLLAACGGVEDPPHPGEAICDGSETLRVRAYFGGGGPVQRGSAVREEHGYESMAIDGRCRYWMNAGWMSNTPKVRDREWRQGTLTRAEVASIEAVLSLRGVAALGQCPPPGAFTEGASRAISSASGRVYCASSNPAFDRAYGAFAALAPALWQRGLAMDGALRVAGVEVDAIVGAQPYDWPLSSPLEEVLLPSSASGGVGESHRLADPQQVMLLRALRTQFFSDLAANPGRFDAWDGIRMRAGTRGAELYLRDAIPYEGANGLLPF